jgi:uncharacterized membrane protein (UPF0127 family)
VLKNKKTIGGLILFILLIIVIFYYFNLRCFLYGNYREKISIENKINLKIEKVESVEKRYLGLSYRKNLCSHCGMLFMMPQKSKYYFSMRNMKFNLDFIWIDGDEIVQINKNISFDFSDLISSQKPIDKVLEISAGLTDKFNIKVGDKIKF